MTRDSPVGEFKYPRARGGRDIERIAPFVRIDLVAYTYRGPRGRGAGRSTAPAGLRPSYRRCGSLREPFADRLQFLRRSAVIFG